MAQYIDKATLIAEIESKFKKYWKLAEESDALQDGNAKYWGGVLSCLNEIKTLINTFEVKEVDLNKELSYEDYKGFFEKYPDLSDDWGFDEAWMFAKHFFELGMLSTITEEDCKLIWNIGDSLPYMPEEDFFKELLRRFKEKSND